MDYPWSPSNDTVGLTPLVELLAALRTTYLSHWASHWRVQGIPQYGDHLLFEKLYSSMPVEIDTLAEKIISIYGHMALTDEKLILASGKFLSLHPTSDDGYGYSSSIYSRALLMEQQLQAMLREVYESMKADGVLSLGMDDFLMATANSHETAIYLLSQRLR